MIPNQIPRSPRPTEFPGLWLQCLAFSAALLVFAGCASHGYVKGNAAGGSMQEASVRVEKESQEIDRTIARLTSLVNEPAPDLRPQFKAYNDALERLYHSIEQTDDAVKRAHDKSTDYFQTWDQQLAALNYQAVRDRGEARRVAVSNELQVINQRYRETTEVVLPLLAYLEDIRKTLGSDLTAGGLEAVKDVVRNADESARKVQGALTQLAAEFAKSGGQMTFTVAAPVELPATGRTESPTAEASNRSTPVVR